MVAGSKLTFRAGPRVGSQRIPSAYLVKVEAPGGGGADAGVVGAGAEKNVGKKVVKKQKASGGEISNAKKSNKRKKKSSKCACVDEEEQEQENVAVQKEVGSYVVTSPNRNQSLAV